MAATLTSKASSLLRAHSDEVHGIADCHRAIGYRLLGDEAHAEISGIKKGYGEITIAFLNIPISLTLP